ncbi:MAG TPA: chorismate mutase, partial [Bacteroidia bacterium]|nr:chorismate mutase [Bacteroidia bacterium]
MSADLKLTPLPGWFPSAKLPLLISGPCGAETEKQVMETAMGIAALNKVHVFRAGIWKPRTRPDSFEGAGEEGLKWLKSAKEETGLKTTVEVAKAEHVELALKYDVDILWVGARTTVNPFYVQEIADALKGVDIPVMVKNPLHPDLQLWIGALERVNRAGIDKLIAIHRGFFSSSNSTYRNAPQWQIAIELMHLIPDLPVICDPSHIAGNRDLILQLAQQALDLKMCGLMIESHIDPDNALSDANQQLTPAALNELLETLVVRKEKSDNIEFQNTLELLRKKIDKIDHHLVETIASRMKIVNKIGEYKSDHNVTILQLERW